LYNRNGSSLNTKKEDFIPMNSFTKIYLVSSLALSLAAPGFASVIVNAPANAAEVTSPFTLSAYSATCSNQTVGYMGYSLDNSSDTTIIKGASVDASVAAPTGAHVLHVKSWGEEGSACVAEVSLTVNPPQTANPVPSYAIRVSAIQILSGWKNARDPATSGNSSGTTSTINSPSLSGTARMFQTQFVNDGGQIYHVSFGDDETSTHFLYDTWLYLNDSASSIANIEMDMNQVMTNGETVIYGFQCDGWSGTWDYTKNAGTPTHPVDTWVHSKASCNVKTWSRNAWHHVQISYSRDNSGNVTYSSVTLDGVEHQINATVNSAFALGWAPTLLTNFQLDGSVALGSSVVYMDQLTISRW
jgi:hypothetical protein